MTPHSNSFLARCIRQPTLRECGNLWQRLDNPQTLRHQDNRKTRKRLNQAEEKVSGAISRFRPKIVRLKGTPDWCKNRIVRIRWHVHPRSLIRPIDPEMLVCIDDNSHRLIVQEKGESFLTEPFRGAWRVGDSLFIILLPRCCQHRTT